jgi:hypothetical protein
MKQRGLLIKTTGEESFIDSAFEEFSLEELQGVVGGLIELCETNTGKVMVINEEGKLIPLPFNPKATMLYKYNDQDVIMGDVIMGDVLIVDSLS